MDVIKKYGMEKCPFIYTHNFWIIGRDRETKNEIHGVSIETYYDGPKRKFPRYSMEFVMNNLTKHEKGIIYRGLKSRGLKISIVA